MGVSNTQLEVFINDLLDVSSISDYAPSGLQIEGKPQIKKIIAGVTASKNLIDKAIESSADAILVHHGYFWKGEDQRIIGIKKKRIEALIKNDINLYSYHLPLDLHMKYGNNIQLAEVLGWQWYDCFPDEKGLPIGFLGKLESSEEFNLFCENIALKLDRKPLVVKAHDKPVQSIAWCTGGAQDLIERAAAVGADVYITGEVSERTVHLARELGINFVSAGHHATERYGVQALGKFLADHFSIEYEYIEVPNPV